MERLYKEDSCNSCPCCHAKSSYYYWTQNDTFRAAGDAVYGTVLEIIFMWIMVIPLVWFSGMKWGFPTLAVFAFCYCDEPIRYVLMQVHLFRGKWIKPVTPEGHEGLKKWRQSM